ncbi:Nitrilase family, member 2 [Seminavis robusta]|uniref:Nitrilase family, member 2 n=1 Tax=Seminavis robusta TaxID=568900 RepID=A0A9N8ES20_9STRA|nr:Nitrilase family, member 2 [Seminavis robusta]|eukprot:Sro1538_g280780.1 Nitrilase family, member 2 (308) ;mRNA; f:14748-15764
MNIPTMANPTHPIYHDTAFLGGVNVNSTWAASHFDAPQDCEEPEILFPVSAQEFDWESGTTENNHNDMMTMTSAAPSSTYKKPCVIQPEEPAFSSMKNQNSLVSLQLAARKRRHSSQSAATTGIAPPPASKLLFLNKKSKGLSLLPTDFEPQPYSILCGQGNENFNAIGNRRFRVTVGMFLQRYQAAKDRQEKSAIVSTVMDILYDACPVGTFIKLKGGRWWQIDEKTAREKVGAHFRDGLADTYKSSAKSKIARRRDRELARRRKSNASAISEASSTAAERRGSDSSIAQVTVASADVSVASSSSS